MNSYLDPNTTLPTPRALITSLINTLTTTPIPKTESQPTVNEPYSATNNGQTSNPFKNLPPSHRALLTTLHVLFPTGMLLQALDLLDRGLVTRVIEHNASTADENLKGRQPQHEIPAVFPPQARIHLPLDLAAASPPTDQVPKEKTKNSLFIVRSSQTPKSRFSAAGGGGGAGGGQSYHVHLSAWNCSCAAFAFSSFPSSLSSSSPWLESPEPMEVGPKASEMDWAEKEWEFGGRCQDGKESGAVPICKHLLACVLAERWEDVLGGLVRERAMEREGMAGLGAE